MTQWPRRGKRDIAALERQLAELELEELSSTTIQTIELNAVEVKSPFPCAGTAAENPKLISVGIDSGAEITAWPPELAPETPTQESEESRSSAKYFWPRRQERSDTRQPQTWAECHHGRRNEANSGGSRGSRAETAAGSL